jgi:hypothetical protein
MPRIENDSTAAPSSMPMWNATAVRSAQGRVRRHHRPAAMNSSVPTINLAATVWNERSRSTSWASSGSTDERTIASWVATRPQVTVPPNQSGSISLLRPDAP